MEFEVSKFQGSRWMVDASWTFHRVASFDPLDVPAPSAIRTDSPLVTPADVVERIRAPSHGQPRSGWTHRPASNRNVGFSDRGSMCPVPTRERHDRRASARSNVDLFCVGVFPSCARASDDATFMRPATRVRKSEAVSAKPGRRIPKCATRDGLIRVGTGRSSVADSRRATGRAALARASGRSATDRGACKGSGVRSPRGPRGRSGSRSLRRLGRARDRGDLARSRVGRLGRTFSCRRGRDSRQRQQPRSRRCRPDRARRCGGSSASARTIRRAIRSGVPGSSLGQARGAGSDAPCARCLGRPRSRGVAGGAVAGRPRRFPGS